MLSEKDKNYIESLVKNLNPDEISEVDAIVGRQKKTCHEALVRELESLESEKNRIADEIAAIEKLLKVSAGENRLHYSDSVVELVYGKSDLKNLHAGDTVSYGRYVQGIDDCTAAPVLWTVLAVEGSKALLLSKYCLEGRMFNSEKKSVLWKDSSLSKWLNTEFIKLFSKNDLSLAIPYNGEKVTLLSKDEIRKYLESGASCIGTVHALKTSDHFIDSTNVSYWLKQDVKDPARVSVITPVGSISRKAVDNPAVSVRPAVWVRMYSA